MSQSATTDLVSNEVRLRRGTISRLVGDGILGDYVPSQVAFALALTFFVPFTDLGWLVVSVMAIPAFLAFTVSYRIRDDTLVASTCGIVILVLDLRESSVGVDEMLASRGLRISVVYVDGARVLRRFPVPRPQAGRISLGYSRAIGRRRREAWVRALRDAA